MTQQNRQIDFTDVPAGKAGVRDFPHDEPLNGEGKEPLQEPGNTTFKAGQEAPRFRVKELIDGTVLVRENMIRQLPYVLFLTFLGVIYIGNRFHAERMVRQINEIKTEVGNLRAEQITTTSELMNISRPSEVAALVGSKNLGLKESLEPPKKLSRR
jgi:hypothetical protein